MVAGGAAGDALGGWLWIPGDIWITNTVAVSFPIKSADEFDISMTYLLLSARKMFAKMSENLNFIYYSAPSRATSAGHAQFHLQLQPKHNWRHLWKSEGNAGKMSESWRCRQCNVIRARIFRVFFARCARFSSAISQLVFTLVFLSVWLFSLAIWVGFSNAAIFMCVHHRAVRRVCDLHAPPW